MKRFFILFILFWNCLVYAARVPEKFDVAVSLGNRCEVATQMRLNGVRLQAYPFDWLVTPFDGLMKYILQRGDGFIEKENLTFNINHPNFHFTGAQDNYYNITLYHDFDYTDPTGTRKEKNFFQVLVTNYDQVKEKYRRRTARFFELLQSNKKVLFVRLDITYKQAVLLDHTIHTLFPNLEYLILAVDHTEEIKRNWGLERVLNIYIPPGDNYWHFPPEVWKPIFDYFNFVKREYTDKDEVIIQPRPL